MNVQSEQTKIDITRPNRLAITSLMIGILLLYPIIGLIIFLVFGGGLLWDQKIISLLFVSLEGIGLVYGTINVVFKGNAITKQLAQTALKNFGMGATAASIV